MRATAVPRAASVPISPVYQVTVLVDVPATSVVALSNGGPATRIGGAPAPTLKKSFAAAIAEAAESEVAASLVTEAASAACRLAAVAVVLPPMVNWFGPGVAEVVAVSVRFSVDPSGTANVNVMVCPLLGLAANETPMLGGEPVTLAPESVEATPASLNPNGEPGTSSEIVRLLPTAGGISRRPRPEPRSAAMRSASTCLKPARVPSPLRIRSVVSTAGWSTARPANR